jgi:hypothetical protein
MPSGAVSRRKLKNTHRLLDPYCVSVALSCARKCGRIDRSQRRISPALAAVSRAEAEEAATIKDYKEKTMEEPQNMGTLGDMLKVKMEK